MHQVRQLNRRSQFRAVLVIALMLIITIASSGLRADTGNWGRNHEAK